MGAFSHCKHYVPNYGRPMCEAGVDIETRAEAKTKPHGWYRRLPCVRSSLTPIDPFSCDLCVFPTPEEEAAAEQQMMADVAKIVSGECPQCGQRLNKRESARSSVSVCPNGCSSMRECRRIGEP